MTFGVYVIFLGKKQRYIGSSGYSVENRLRQHTHMLRKGKCRSVTMQHDYDETKHFSFKVYLCAAEEAKELEQAKIDYWRSRGLAYNKNPSAFSSKGAKLSEVAKANIAASKTGLKASLETRDKMRAAGLARYQNKDEVARHSIRMKNMVTPELREIRRTNALRMWADGRLSRRRA